MARQTGDVHGDLPDIPVGLMFADREDLHKSGLHNQTIAGISGTKAEGGAFSIVLNEGYEDDEDRGNEIIYTGEGKGKPEEGQERIPGKKQQGDQDMKSRGNAALQKNVESGLPVRVIRGPNGNLKYSPLQGYRYDGLYDVKEAYIEKGEAGFKMCKFRLERATVPTQDELPLHITGKGANDDYWSIDGREKLGKRRVNNPASSEPSASTSDTASQQAIQEKRREIAGKPRLGNMSFSKKKSVSN
ncbi:PUA-like domain-containing protein [Favolaschia claudopus]|uniref:PUA-like domain-containing protein n=1 Tax=Favolaschia claudopus TaxID=2862362 RepID=A0AAW0D735_9AGAR